MADFPIVATVPEIMPVQLNDPTLDTQYDQGYIQTRPRYSRGLRRYELIYHGITRADLVILYRFIRDTLRVRATTFSWTYIHKETITNATNATPIVITVQNGHMLRTGDTVVIADVGGTTAANGTHVITDVSATTFRLDGSVGNGAYTTGGTAQLRLLKMALDTENDTLSTIEKIIGRDSDNVMRSTFTLIFEERF
jgi:hypothetical protein